MPTFQQFAMPDAGEGLTEADIITWRVAVGDTVEVNQPLVEIETAKSLVELPCPWDGVVTKLLAVEGDTVDVGVAIVEIDVDPGGEPAPEAAPEAESADKEPPAEQSTEPVQSAPSGREDLSSDSSAAVSDAAPQDSASGEAQSIESSDDEGSGAVLVGY